jgi:hypothetical protein
MHNKLKQSLDYWIEKLKDDLSLIADKNKDDEWKRDHYRHTFAVAAQRIFDSLNTSITENPPAGIKESTKMELVYLKEILEKMINSSSGKL